MNRFFFALLAIAGGSVASAAAQRSHPDSVLPRILMRRLDSLVNTREVQRLTKARTAWELLTTSPIGAIDRLDDTTLMHFVAVLNRGLAQAQPETCANFWHSLGTLEYGRAYAAVAAEVDSVTADAWVGVIVRLVWVGLRGEDQGRRATTAEKEAVTQYAQTLIPPQELQEITRIQALAHPQATDACFLIRSVFRSMLRLPAAKVAPVFRTMIGP